jgi:hypothetical protein
MPASPLYLRPPSALAAALDRAARRAPAPRIFAPNASQGSSLAFDPSSISDQQRKVDRRDWMRGVEEYLVAAHPGAVLALIAEVEAAYPLASGGGGGGGGGGGKGIGGCNGGGGGSDISGGGGNGDGGDGGDDGHGDGGGGRGVSGVGGGPLQAAG